MKKKTSTYLFSVLNTQQKPHKHMAIRNKARLHCSNLRIQWKLPREQKFYLIYKLKQKKIYVFYKYKEIQDIQYNVHSKIHNHWLLFSTKNQENIKISLLTNTHIKLNEIKC